MADIMRRAVDVALEDLRKRSRRVVYLTDPVLWAEEVLGVTLWSGQKEVLRSLVDNKKTAVKSCHSIGKTFLSAVAACWWVSTRDDCMVQTSAPTYHQVHGLLWEEIRKMHARSGLPGRILDKDVWKIDWQGIEIEVGVGKKPADSNIHGFHGTHRTGGVLVILDEGCHDDQTDVMTADGWKRWADVTEDDLFLTMDPKTHEARYHKAERLIAYDYDGDLYYYSAKGANFAVTPNHEMYYEQIRANVGQGYRKAEIQDMVLSNKMMLKSIQWTGDDSDTFVLPALEGARKTWGAREFDAEDWAEFIGWFGSEGSIDKAVRCVSIAQKKAENRDKVRDLLTRMGWKFFETDNGFGISSTQLAEHLVQYGRTCETKRLPDYVRTWSPRLLNTMLDAYVLGDGYSRDSHDIIYTSCENMAGDLQEAILKTGMPSVVHKRELAGVPQTPLADGRQITATRDGWVVTRPTRDSRIKVTKDNLEIKHYSGKVYCALVPPDHLLFTRRNGYSLWSGNCGIPVSIYTASDAITTAPMDRVLSVGNPDDPNTEFGRIFNQPTGEWNLITVSAYDTPNFTGEDVPDYLKKSLPQPEWVESRKREWGEDSARFQSKVLAQFPEQGSDAFFSQMAIDTAYDLDLPDDLDVDCILGVDVAGYGDNYSVIYSNRGGRVRQHSRWAGGNAVESADKIHTAALETGAVEVRIDGSGFGSAIVDLVSNLAGDTYRVIKVLGGAASQDIMKHANARAEQFDNLRNLMLKGEVDLDRNDVELSKQLLSLKYKFTTRGGIQIESKKDMSSRGAPSPDELDGVVYATLDTTSLLQTSEIDSLSPGDRLFLDMMDMMGGEPSWWIGY